MRTLSKSEMKAVSGGIDCGAYQPYNSYSCSPYPVVNPPAPQPKPCTRTVWVGDNYGNGYWKCVN